MKESNLQAPTGRVIVLDTAALIAGTDALYSLGGLVDAKTGNSFAPPTKDEQVTFYTTPDVINEVRDKRARARLALLDGSVIVRAPSAEALADVINFAKATGDFSVLSTTDLKVMALCWLLEHERNGGTLLKQPPQKVRVSEIRCGRLIPFAELEKLETDAQKVLPRTSNEDDEWQIVKGKATATEQIDLQRKDVPEPVDKPPKEPAPTATRRSRRRRRKKSPSMEGDTVLAISSCNDETSFQEGSAGEIPRDLHEMKVTEDAPKSQVANISKEEESATEDRAEDDDGMGWINNENLPEYLAREGGEEEQTQQDFNRIGCVTTDFAMQNTMLQMGLKLLSVDGRRAIKKIKHFALRCHTCGCVTTEHERVFCYRCGNATMHRVAFKIDKKGVARSFINPKKQPILRGTKYPIPMPRGGRHNRDLILCEDQIDSVKQKRLQKQRERLNVDVLDPSNFYNAGARFDPNNRPLIVGYGRRNPNEVRRTSHRKR